MKNTLESAKGHLLKQISIAQSAILLVGLFYVSGYYINSMFLANYGISSTELLKLEYIKIGFVFWLIVCGIIFLPFGAFYLTSKVRKTSGLPHYWLGLLGNSLNVIIMLGVPIALSFFVTNYEWDYVFPQKTFLGTSSFKTTIIIALGLSTFGIIILPAIERIVVKYTKMPYQKLLFWGLIEPFRFGSLFLSIFLIATSFTKIPWLSVVFGKSMPFFSVVVVLGSGLLAAYYWTRFIKETEGSLMVIPIISLGFAFFYYLALASYVYGVYPSIPSNRGGKLPLTEVYLNIDGYDFICATGKKQGKINLKGPIYVIENTDKELYFATSKDMSNWFIEFIPINLVKKSKIKNQLSVRINDGYPKIPRD